MSKFDSKLFGDNLKKYRKAKGLSQDNLAYSLGKTSSTISKYENGEVIMTADDIYRVCEELDIYATDLFEEDYKTTNKENNNNPFKTDKLYMYFNAYDYKHKTFKKGKYVLSIQERPDFTRVDFLLPDDDKIQLRGYMQADKSVAFISFENYEPNNARLEHSLIEISIVNGVDGLMMGAFVGTNASYIPSIRKCYFSKKDIEFTDEMLDNLKLTELEVKGIEESNAIYLDIFND